jgi:GNAT superfamily N-acetyltransferase
MLEPGAVAAYPGPNVIELSSALERSLPELAQLEAESTADYAIARVDDAYELARRLAVDAVDLGVSFVARLGGKDVGVVFVARRGGFQRIDGVSVLPDARNKGVGAALLDAVRAGARNRGDVKLIAEADERSEAALRLFRSAGFHGWRRLLGWRREQPNVLTRDPSRTVVELPLRHAAWACARHADKDLPWPFAPESIANLSPPYRAFEHDHSAYCIVRSLPDGGMRVRALIVRNEARGRGLGSAVLAGALKALGANRVEVPSWCPEGIFDNFFTRCGFKQDDLKQVEFRLSVHAAGSS